MNSTTIRILQAMLPDVSMWDKKTGKPKTKIINEQLHLARKTLFYDEVYYPHVKRFMDRAVRMGIFKKKEVSTFTLGYNVEFDCLYPDDLYCQERLAELFQNALFYSWSGFDYRCQWNGKSWDRVNSSSNWCYEDVDEEDIKSLGICPIVMQPTLF